MCTKLILAIVFIMSFVPRAVKADPPLLQRAKDSSEIVGWGEKTFGSCPHYEFESKGKKCLVLLPDVASGITLRLILVYGLNKDGWELVITRNTNSSTIKIEQAGDSLQFRSRSGLELMSVRIASLDLGFDPKEQ